MKWILAFAMLAFFKMSGVGQEAAHRDFFKTMGQDTTWLTFTKEDDTWLFWEKEGKERKVRKDMCEVWFNYDLANEPWPMVDGEVAWQRVVVFDSMKADDIFLGSKLWFANAFRSGKDVVQVDDKEAGTVQGKGYSDMQRVVVLALIKFELWYSIKMEAKDGRMRMTIFDLKLKGEPSEYDRNPQANPIKMTGVYQKGEKTKKWKRMIFEEMERILADAEKDIRDMKAASERW